MNSTGSTPNPSIWSTPAAAHKTRCPSTRTSSTTRTGCSAPWNWARGLHGSAQLAVSGSTGHDLAEQLGDQLHPMIAAAIRVIPGASPVIPEAVTSFQLVHHDDCADALVAAIEGRGAPGIYNLAGDGAITIT